MCCLVPRLQICGGERRAEPQRGHSPGNNFPYKINLATLCSHQVGIVKQIRLKVQVETKQGRSHLANRWHLEEEYKKVLFQRKVNFGGSWWLMNKTISSFFYSLRSALNLEESLKYFAKPHFALTDK